MSEYIMIVAGISYMNNRCIISCVESTVDYPFLQVGASVTDALKALRDLGYEVYPNGSDGSTATYLITLDDEGNGGTVPRALAARLNTIVTIYTPTGSETGTLTLVGTDFVQLTAANGDLILIPASAILSFS